jgi:hypothetical protein
MIVSAGFAAEAVKPAVSQEPMAGSPGATRRGECRSEYALRLFSGETI